jgi:hypothetical protein
MTVEQSAGGGAAAWWAAVAARDRVRRRERMRGAVDVLIAILGGQCW